MKTKLVKIKNNVKIDVIEDTQFVLDFTAADHRENILHLVFKKQGVRAQILGLYNLKDNESLSFTTISEHIVPNTACTTDVRGVLNDSSTSVYFGKILINKEAQQTESFLDDAVLVLGDNTKHRSDPILEIEADDVKASHGSTTGRVDEDQVYYLQSRGVKNEEAQGLIVQGFFEDALSKIADREVKQKVRKLVSA